MPYRPQASRTLQGVELCHRSAPGPATPAYALRYDGRQSSGSAPVAMREGKERGGDLDLNDLIERGLVPAERLDELRRVADRFSVALSDDAAALIDPADPNDPIAAQFLPQA